MVRSSGVWVVLGQHPGPFFKETEAGQLLIMTSLHGCSQHQGRRNSLCQAAGGPFLRFSQGSMRVLDLFQ